jgi:hypothetical protein
MSRVIYFASWEDYRSDPIPGVPDRQEIKDEPDNDQKLIIGGWVGGQPDQIKDKKEYGYDNVCPAIDRVIQRQGQENHNDRGHH